jgi:ABC-type dipeptide/oligopeptide/nickel transport system ATPase subunit
MYYRLVMVARLFDADVNHHTAAAQLSRKNESGSGKSSLAEGLGALIHEPIFGLIRWKDDGYGAKQDDDVARQKVPT